MADLVKYKVFSSHRNFGVELEVSNSVSKSTIYEAINSISNKSIRVAEWEQSRNNNFWHIKQDSTCGPEAHLHKDYGWEVASFKASGPVDLIEISAVTTAIRNAGVQVNNNCGLHVHVEVPEFSAKQMGVLLAWWIKIEPFICYLLPSRRLKNKHCKIYHKDKKIKSFVGGPYELWDLLKPNNFEVHGNNQKKRSLNFVNFAEALRWEEITKEKFDRKTIELRLPEGTLESEDVASWVKIMVMFVDNMVSAYMPENLSPIKDLKEFFQIIGLEQKDCFVILSEGLYKTKLWICRRIDKSDWAKANSKGIKVCKEAEEKMLILL